MFRFSKCICYSHSIGISVHFSRYSIRIDNLHAFRVHLKIVYSSILKLFLSVLFSFGVGNTNYFIFTDIFFSSQPQNENYEKHASFLCHFSATELVDLTGTGSVDRKARLFMIACPQ